MNIDIPDLLRALEVDERVDDSGGRVVQGECETVRSKRATESRACVLPRFASVGGSAALGDVSGRPHQPRQDGCAVRTACSLSWPSSLDCTLYPTLNRQRQRFVQQESSSNALCRVDDNQAMSFPAMRSLSRVAQPAGGAVEKPSKFENFKF